MYLEKFHTVLWHEHINYKYNGFHLLLNIEALNGNINNLLSRNNALFFGFVVYVSTWELCGYCYGFLLPS